MNNYYDRFLSESKGAWSYQEWLIDKMEKAEKNIYDLLTLQKQTEHKYFTVAEVAKEFISAIRKGNNKLAHYKMLELEGLMEEYERRK